MKYLNLESQFTRVSDEQARWLMESVGYSSEAPATIESVYFHNNERFVLSEEVVEGDDDFLYLRIEHVDDLAIIEIDASGRETIIESVMFDDEDFQLTGVFEDEDGLIYAKMVSESYGGDDDEEEAEESEESEEKEE